MTKRRFLLVALAALLTALAIGWLVLPSRVAYFTLDKRLRIEVNGVPVEGEILGNRFSAIVTIRDVGKKHSYQLFYAGDVDKTGDMGLVVDCRQWVAPHFPLLLQTRDYPPCKRLPEDEYWSLMRRGHSMQFVTKDHSTISVAARTMPPSLEPSQSNSTPAVDDCELTAFPVSLSAKEILAAVPRGGTSRNSMMFARIKIDAEGKVTHLRVLRLAHPELPNAAVINEQAVDSIKRWRYAPTRIAGKPVPVCSDVGVIIDLQ